MSLQDGIRAVHRAFTDSPPARWPLYVRQAKQHLRTAIEGFDERKYRLRVRCRSAARGREGRRRSHRAGSAGRYSGVPGRRTWRRSRRCLWTSPRPSTLKSMAFDRAGRLGVRVRARCRFRRLWTLNPWSLTKPWPRSPSKPRGCRASAKAAAPRAAKRRKPPRAGEASRHGNRHWPESSGLLASTRYARDCLSAACSGRVHSIGPGRDRIPRPPRLAS